MSMIITRYIIREITTSFLIVFTTLVLIYAGYSTAMVLADATGGSLHPGIIPRLVFLNTVKVLDLILPSALYFSVILAFGRMYRDSEMIALMASGYSEMQVMRAVLYLTLAVALLVGFLSTAARPWAFRTGYSLEARAMDELDIERLQAGVFTELQRNNHTLYAGEIDSSKNRLKNILLQSDYGRGKTRLITADTLHLPARGEGALKLAEFANGHLYLLDRNGPSDHILEFETLRLYLKGGVPATGYKRKAVKTETLLDSTKLKEVAELQWRLAAPVTTILLPLLGVPLSRMQPRQRRYSRILPAILIYALFFNLSGMVRTWVERERIAALPGIWWVHILCLILLLALFLPPRCSRRASRR